MNNTINYKGYIARVEYSADDEVFVGRVVGLRDIITFHGETVKELKEQMKEMIEFYLDVCKKKGKKPQKTYSGKVFLRVDPELHAKIAEAAESKGKSINEFGTEVFTKVLK